MLGTVEALCHAGNEIACATRSCDDFKHHPEQLVLLYDESIFDENGKINIHIM
jgi:hypothetical protein